MTNSCAFAGCSETKDISDVKPRKIRLHKVATHNAEYPLINRFEEEEGEDISFAKAPIQSPPKVLKVPFR